MSSPQPNEAAVGGQGCPAPPTKGGLGLRDVTSIVTGASALVAGLGTAIDGMQKLFPWLAKIDKPYLSIIAFFLAALTVFLQRGRLEKKSELKRPDALYLDPTNPEKLVGREQDIQNLLVHLSNATLLWLAADSGVGKSALLQAGLLPALRKDPTRIPIYLNALGSDWDTGPLEALTYGLRQFFHERLEKKIENSITSTNVMKTLSEFGAKGRLPVLLFDQFDDYQVKYKQKFLSHRKDVISPEHLTQQNSFWKNIQTMLQEGRIHCLFATRDALGLGCVRFVPEISYALDRLQPGEALTLLAKLTGGDVILNPEDGWEQLKRRVCEDLEAGGSLLPIQMKVVFRGLARLPYLTVKEYQRRRGLPGLEALHIAYHISETARHSGLEPDQVRTILRSMVDTQGEKTLPKAEEELLKVSGYKSDGEKIHKALENLEAKEIVREQNEYVTGSSTWLLDHDYLCRGILELEGQARYWPKFLEDAAQTFERARGLWGSFKTLLAPAVQLRLLLERIRGRLKYGKTWPFALRSTIRLLLNAPVLIAALCAYGGYYINVRSNASRLYSEIGLDPTYTPMTSREAKALWDLRDSSYDVRRQVLDDVVSQEAAAKRFLNRPEEVIAAIVGLDQTTRSRLIRDVLFKCYRISWDGDSNTSRACAQLVQSLDAGSPQAVQFVLDALKTGDIESSRSLSIQSPDILLAGIGLPSEAVGWAAFLNLLEAVNSARDRVDLSSLGVGFAAIVPKLTEAQASAALVQLMQARKNPSLQTVDRSTVLDRGLATVAQGLNEKELPPALSQFLTLIKQVKDATELQILAGGMLTISDKLNEPDARAAFAQLMDARQASNNKDRSLVLATILGRLAAKVSETEVASIYTQLFGLVDNTSDSSEMWALIFGMEKTGAKLNESAARAAFLQLMEARKTSHGDRSTALAAVLGTITARLPETDTSTAFSQLLEAMKRVTNPLELGALARGLSALRGERKDADVRAVIERLVKEVETASNTRALSSVEAGLTAFCESLTDSQAKWAIARLRQAWKNTADEFKEGSFIAGMKAVANNLNEKDTSEAFAQFLQGLNRTYSYVSTRFGDALVATAPKLNEIEATRASNDLMQYIKQTSDPEKLGLLVKAWSALHSPLNESEIQIAVSQTVHSIDKNTSGSGLDKLDTGLASLADRMDGKEALDAFTQLLQSIDGSGWFAELRSLVAGLKVVGRKIDDRDIDSVLSKAMDVLIMQREPPCSVLVPLIRKGTQPRIVEVVKWPTCQRGEREQLIAEIARLEGKTFTIKGIYPSFTNQTILDFWGFAGWAEHEGLDLKSPPSKRPTFDN